MPLAAIGHVRLERGQASCNRYYEDALGEWRHQRQHRDRQWPHRVVWQLSDGSDKVSDACSVTSGVAYAQHAADRRKSSTQFFNKSIRTWRIPRNIILSLPEELANVVAQRRRISTLVPTTHSIGDSAAAGQLDGHGRDRLAVSDPVT